MNSRVFAAASAFVLLLGFALPAAAAVRAEIARDIRLAHFYSHGGLAMPAMEKIKAAEAVSGQTAEEQQAVAKAKAAIAAAGRSSMADQNFDVFPSSQAVLPPNYSPNPPSQTPNNLPGP